MSIGIIHMKTLEEYDISVYKKPYNIDMRYTHVVEYSGQYGYVLVGQALNKKFNNNVSYWGYDIHPTKVIYFKLEP